MKVVKFDIAAFNKTKSNKDNLSNGILYKMCADYPLHTNPEEIRAKILIIGRVYAAAIERRKKKRHINDDFYGEVVEEFVKFNEKVGFDSKLSSLKNKEFNEKNLKEIIGLHQELVNFFNKLTGLEKRSLASKYLHFHVPIFPIYDSRASNTLRKIITGNNSQIAGDKEYSKFCNKILFLHNHIENKNGKSPSIREIDTYLLKTANKELKNRE